ncbi:flagellar basal-body rod protein FlgG [Blastochloris sulfoviridis]|uniref:Flagellar basal-body rod protein FlgG n=1 Tax=Blastochloris sulfoviridis TaxID=50712 RepID=A0A5M6I4H0_9HYPH|nr:flagellar basal-body rod protein FlgG [Blastochloris sulfoviridis]KAA5602757.1 flagellar basal-body rod protein FlgG [Blastochloris sulfoviridis]
MRAMHTAATGMMAQELNVSIISNNIANMRTTGYKRQRAEFQDLLYESLRRVGSQTSDQGTMVPTGVQIGSGVKTAGTSRIMSQGTLTSTDRDFDVAIRGEGFFQIELPDGRTAYTRDGSFELDANGKMVTVDGYTVDPGITIPNNASNITINSQGQITAVIGNATASTTLGQLQLSRFVNKSGLEAIGDNLFLETAASGSPQQGTPGSEGFGTTLQRYLEAANVNSVTELTDLISAQRAYEMNARVITAADEMSQATANLSR